MLPPISASNGSIIFSFWVVFHRRPPREPRSDRRNCLVVRALPVSRFVLRNEEREDGGQEHEDQRLNEADEQLQKVKWNGNQPGERRNHMAHRLEHRFTGINISEQPEAEGNRTEED